MSGPDPAAEYNLYSVRNNCQSGHLENAEISKLQHTRRYTEIKKGSLQNLDSAGPEVHQTSGFNFWASISQYYSSACGPLGANAAHYKNTWHVRTGMEGERGGGTRVGRSFGGVGRRYGDRVTHHGACALNKSCETQDIIIGHAVWKKKKGKRNRTYKPNFKVQRNLTNTVYPSRVVEVEMTRSGSVQQGSYGVVKTMAALYWGLKTHSPDSYVEIHTVDELITFKVVNLRYKSLLSTTGQPILSLSRTSRSSNIIYFPFNRTYAEWSAGLALAGDWPGRVVDILTDRTTFIQYETLYYGRPSTIWYIWYRVLAVEQNNFGSIGVILLHGWNVFKYDEAGHAPSLCGKTEGNNWRPGMSPLENNEESSTKLELRPTTWKQPTAENNLKAAVDDFYHNLNAGTRVDPNNRRMGSNFGDINNLWTVEGKPHVTEAAAKGYLWKLLHEYNGRGENLKESKLQDDDEIRDVRVTAISRHRRMACLRRRIFRELTRRRGVAIALQFRLLRLGAK
ncbi:hypothetical protein B0H14DRAFT_2605599 [Mycena olivaceomarginata]|nr:hypothetical protein B0H14DRAFT_2605599 [Mycena olivaceomarginata]